MTRADVNADIASKITDKTTAGSLSNTEDGSNREFMMDYVDQEFLLSEKLSNKSTNVTTDGASNIKYPSVKSVKDYVDNSVSLSESWVNKSINIITDGASDLKYPSVKAVKTYVDNKSIGLSYDSYVVSLSQTSTNAPIETYTFENTIGSIVWTYSGVGIYLGTLSGAFPISKTFLMVNQNKAGKRITLEQVSASQIKILTLSDISVNENDVLNLTSIEIRVYN